MKTRFAPSPTGHIHLGNARTALFNYLFAQGQEGTFLLRIEDTDKTRSEKRLADELMQDLHWLGIAWQEGPGAEGPHAPYWQSERQEIYDLYYAKLIERNLVYPCFCSDEELVLQRKVQLSRGQPPRYAGICRDFTDAQIQAKYDQELPATLRFRVPENSEVVFEDLVKGRQVFLTQNIGDFIIRRADGTPTFFFCNAIDDALMKVSTIFRGDDHLTNTPRQLLIMHALGLTPPQYGHIALILGNDGAPLSKRNGSLSIAELRERGFLSEAVVNYLARLGHYYEQTCWLSPEELAEFFKISTLGTAPARFDEIQLLHWQREAVMRLTEENFWKWCDEATQNLVPKKLRTEFYEAIQPNILFPLEVKHWAEILFGQLSFSEEALAGLRQAGKAYFEKAVALWPASDFKAFTHALGDALQVKGKALFEPLRLALTGQTHGPELVQLEKFLGKEKIQQRLQGALEL